MATNKHATIRYNALDKCFSNWGRKYFIEDLIEACNNAIYEFSGILKGVKRRQIFDDIKFMESEQGWSVPLDKIRDGRRVFYRYSDKKFSIKKQAINESEANQLKETLLILSRFKGMPNFIEELLVKIESTLKLKSTKKPIIGFEHNRYLKGVNFFTDLFNSILYKQTLCVYYQGFKQEEAIRILLHPYFLKQYNNRWFLFGFNESTKSISNLALDRIIEVKEVKTKFIENTTINFDEYFDNVVGVTVLENENPIKIKLQVSNQILPYIESKPIHGSQKKPIKNTEGAVIELFLQLNYEFISLLFSYGEEITVIEPEELKNIIKTKAKKLLENYF